jgi:hypothetical protein
LRPTILFDIADEDSWRAYLKGYNKPEHVPHVKGMTTSMWSSMMGEDEERHLDMLLGEAFEELERLGEEMVTKSMYFCTTDEEVWKDWMGKYKVSLTSILTGMIMRKQSTTQDIANVKKGLARKIKWYLFDHQANHYAPVLPLITPSILECLGQVLQACSNAIGEVCIS